MLQHLITGEELSLTEIQSLLILSSTLKEMRKKGQNQPTLHGKHLAMLFEKSSFRTRFSFTIAMQELGGTTIESVSHSRKKEEPEDMIGVLSGYCHALMIRTHSDQDLIRMKKVSTIPIINALSNYFHPCQILSDFLTLKETFRDLENLKLTYIGDGNNILHSLLLMAPLLGIHLHYCCPATREPKKEILEQSKKRAIESTGSITTHPSPESAAHQAHAIYTDVWESMGFENTTNEEIFSGFQLNEKLMEMALPDAVCMHCMPMIRGKEISSTLPDSKSSVIFQQSENRLHVQKALLLTFLGEKK